MGMPTNASCGCKVLLRNIYLVVFYKVCSLPTHKEIGIEESATRVNQAVKCVLSQVNEPPKKKQKVYTTFKRPQQAAIRKYAAECGKQKLCANINKKFPILVRKQCAFSRSVTWNINECLQVLELTALL